MLALFGLVVCWVNNLPWYWWLIGFLCLLLDANVARACANSVSLPF